MQTNVLVYETFKFSELTPEAQDHAIEKLWDINVDYGEWHEYTLDYWQDEKLPELGFTGTNKIYYSGFSSQGDGAMFEADELDLLKFMQVNHLANTFRRLHYWVNQGLSVYCKVQQYGHYHHERSFTLDFEIEDIRNYLEPAGQDYSPRQIKQIDGFETECSDFEDYLKEKLVDINHDIYKSLEQEYEYLTSREQIIETIEANDYDFFENGDMD